MGLATYHRKRHFNRTPEPEGRESKKKSERQLSYVIQKHDASRLHYDFRLELDGVLKSWAVPKGPSLDPARKALAVQVEDHPLEYGDFEGVIPKGEYGGGTVLLWDRGSWEPLGDAREGLAKGKIHFILHGEKLHGEWSLIRMHGPSGGDGKNWLLMKINDQFAGKTRDILAEASKSVKSTRSIEKIADDRNDVWSRDAKNTAKISKSHKASLPEKLSPQLAVLAEHPPRGEQWLHEIKFDGYRLLAFIKSGTVTLYTRHGLDWTGKFPGIARALAKLKVDSAIVDGEAVVVDAEGRSDFQALQAALKNPSEATPVYYAFDLPFCDGVDLRESPLIERKELLDKVLKRSRLGSRINYSDHVRGDGDEVITKACAMALEGIVSKRADSPYVSRRDASWLKSKCSNRQEFIIIGYTDPQGSRAGFGSLLLGYNDERRRLVYAGRVGTGFDDKKLREMIRQLQEISRKDAPTDVPPPPRERRAAHWVEPKMVAEIRFSNWTTDGMLRHPVFIALRSDKPASEIIREKPVQPEKLALIKAAKRNGRQHAEQAKKDAVAGVTLSHPSKLLFIDEKISKQRLAEYYLSVQEWMLPHVMDRPLALVRCTAGIPGKCFFNRNWSETMPAAVDKIQVGDSRKSEQHVTIHDLAGVISLVQISVLEIHAWNCKNSDVLHPDQLIFDLDPGPDLPWNRLVEGVKTLRNTLMVLKLPMFLKTSGGKGFHVVIPIKPSIDWATAKTFCKTIAVEMTRQSELFVANMRKDLRGGKIYIDFNRNDHFATAVAPYSSRARAGGPVSMPIGWEDLEKLKSANQFTVENAAAHLARRRKDPWSDFDRSRVDLRAIVDH